LAEILSRHLWPVPARGLGALATLVLAQLAVSPASAQGKLEARYEVTLAGIPVGRGTWSIDIAEDHYSATVSGATVGLLKAISGGHGNGTAQGRIVNGQLAPVAYTATSETSKKAETIRIALAGWNVTDSSITPEPPVDEARIPVTEAHRRGVFDPMTGSMIRVPGAGDLVTPEACKSAAAIFDGRMRYNLRLEYRRMETVKAEKGYRGPAVVCGIFFTPVSGYVPDRAAIKYLAAQKSMEVWLVPIAGTRVLVPFKLSIPTPLGHGVMVATQFKATAIPPRAASR
jgi:hypothetical protein